MKLLLICGSIILGMLSASSTEAAFPSDIEKCKKGDTECYLKQLNYVVQTKTKGDKSLNLVSVDPLKISAIDIKQGAESPVNIDLKFRNCELHGLKGLHAYKASGFDKDLKGPHELRANGPFVSLIGDYTINGRILILPITGAGKANITLLNPDMLMRMEGKSVEKDGKIFMEIMKTAMKLKVSRVISDFTNLFNGDKALGDAMNLFMNENWKDIWGELEHSVLKAFQLIFKSMINNVFAKYPYDELFLD